MIIIINSFDNIIKLNFNNFKLTISITCRNFLYLIKILALSQKIYLKNDFTFHKFFKSLC